MKPTNEIRVGSHRTSPRKAMAGRLFARLVASIFLVGASASWAGESRYVVMGDDLADLASAVDQVGGKFHEKLRYHKAFTATLDDDAASAIQHFFGSGTLIEKDGIASLCKDTRVPSADIKAAGKPSAPPPAQGNSWGFEFIHAPSAWTVTRGAGVKVGILDTGIQKNHPDLQANIAGGATFIGTKWEDDNGHGTHVAGIVAAVDNTIGSVGVAPSAHLFVVKVLDRNGNGNTSVIADGVRSCMANGVQVINMSFESATDSTLLRLALTDAYNAGIVLVAAAGNGGLPDVAYPARYPEVLAISAISLYSPSPSGVGTFRFLSYSNYGPKIAFAAPGNQIWSTWRGSSYTTLSGTSQAAPFVSGVVALMIASGNVALVGRDIGLLPDQQGSGLIDAFLTVQGELALAPQ